MVWYGMAYNGRRMVWHGRGIAGHVMVGVWYFVCVWVDALHPRSTT